MTARIRPARAEDLGAIESLLGDAGLPTTGVALLVALGRVQVADDAATLIGCTPA